jgi:hypothetical protein
VGVAELIHAEVFSDFTGMAHELQTSGYKDAPLPAVELHGEHIGR